MTSVDRGSATGGYGDAVELASTAAATAAVDLPITPPPVALDAGPSPRRWLTFGIVTVALLMAAIDQTIVATALGAIRDDLHADLGWTAWTITIYALGQIVAMPIVGAISDQYGRKRIFLGAVVVFMTASLCCSVADNIYLLVAFRALQSLGGGAFLPSASGIVADQFGGQRDRALGLFTSVFPIGTILGPIFGGVIVTYFSWRGIFLINVPICLAIVVLGLKLIPASTLSRRARPDWISAVLLALTILSAMYAVTTAGGGSAVSLPPVAGALVLAVVLGWLLVRHASRVSQPFIPLALVRGRGFVAMNVINVAFGAVVLGFGTMVPLYAQERYGLRALESGTLLTFRGIGMICLAGLATMSLRRIGHRLPMLVGFLVVGAGILLVAMSPHGLTPYHWLTLGTLLTGMGMGLSAPASNNATLQLAPDQIASVSGLRGMFRQSGGIVAITVTTAIITNSSDPGVAQAHTFVALAVLIMSMVFLLRLVPEHRGAW